MWNKKKQRRLNMLQGIRVTSKASLKMQCLMACKGDIDESLKLYDFFVKDMPNLPETDPVPPTWLDNTKATINGLMGWIKDNQDTLAQGYEIVRSVIQKKGLPMLPSAGEPLPPINE